MHVYTTQHRNSVFECRNQVRSVAFWSRPILPIAPPGECLSPTEWMGDVSCVTPQVFEDGLTDTIFAVETCHRFISFLTDSMASPTGGPFRTFLAVNQTRGRQNLSPYKESRISKAPVLTSSHLIRGLCHVQGVCSYSCICLCIWLCFFVSVCTWNLHIDICVCVVHGSGFRVKGCTWGSRRQTYRSQAGKTLWLQSAILQTTRAIVV